MFTKTSSKVKSSPWSDDHPEKMVKQPQTVGFNQQMKGLINPSYMIDSMFGKRSGSETPFAYNRNEKSPKKTETTTIFTYKERAEDQSIRRETAVLLDQLKKQVTLLEKSEKTLTSQITKVKVEQLPDKNGIYYVRFFEWLLLLVRQLRAKVEEGQAWLSTFTSRKKKKLGYWKMYKKHGTTFGLSHERTLATQTG